jgi:hypothetical protein
VPDHLNKGLPWTLLLQVKHHTGQEGPAALDQLRTAFYHYRKDGRILGAYLLITADAVSPDFEARRKELANELGIDVVTVLKHRLAEFLAEGLSGELTEGA